MYLQANVENHGGHDVEIREVHVQPPGQVEEDEQCARETLAEGAVGAAGRCIARHSHSQAGQGRCGRHWSDGLSHTVHRAQGFQLALQTHRPTDRGADAGGIFAGGRLGSPPFPCNAPGKAIAGAHLIKFVLGPPWGGAGRGWAPETARSPGWGGQHRGERRPGWGREAGGKQEGRGRGTGAWLIKLI